MTITHRPQDTGWNQRYGHDAEDRPAAPSDVVRLQLAHRSGALLLETGDRRLGARQAAFGRGRTRRVVTHKALLPGLR